MLIFAALLALVALLSGCSEPDAEATITGRVQWQGRGIPLAWVEVYTKPEQDRSIPPVAETATSEEGTFAVNLPAGRYWVWARATLEEGERELRLVGQATPNPVEPKPGGSAAVEISLEDPSGFASSSGPTGAGAVGRVDDKILGKMVGEAGKPVHLYFYEGSVKTPIGPGFVATVSTQEDATFRIDLAPGDYTLSARLHASGLDYGPPGPNDLVAVVQFSVKPLEYFDLGSLALTPLDPKKWRETTSTLGGGDTLASGVTLNADGTPAKGLWILAFTDSRMAGKPAAISPTTDERGRFVVYLPQGGRYFLGARSKVGGPASPGEKIGTYRGPDGDGVQIGENERVEGIEITVEEIW
jgi:hypothetical protein